MCNVVNLGYKEEESSLCIVVNPGMGEEEQSVHRC